MEQPTVMPVQVYQIGSAIYRLEPQSWKQAKWLGDTIFKDRDVQTIDYATIHDCGRAQAPLFMAIALLAEGQTREQKSKLPWSAIEALAQEFEAHLTGWEVARFCTHFFYLCRPDQMVMLMTGRRMQEELHKILDAQNAKIIDTPEYREGLKLLGFPEGAAKTEQTPGGFGNGESSTGPDHEKDDETR